MRLKIIEKVSIDHSVSLFINAKLQFLVIFDHFGAIFNSGAFKFNSGPVIHYQTKINAKYKAFKLDSHTDTKIFP